METLKTKRSFKDLLLKKPVPFSDKRDVNWTVVRNIILVVMVFCLFGILLVPGKAPEIEFSDRDRPTPEREIPMSIPEGTYTQPRTFQNYSYQNNSRAGSERQAPMVVSREGLDSANQIQPGARVKMRLLERVVVGNQSVPVIAIVTEDFMSESGVAIPKGSRAYGEVSFDQDANRGSVAWRSLQLPGGRIRQFEALATTLDGQTGLSGIVHSEALKNAVGHTMTRFVGAYAEGSMEKSGLFGSKGGHENGMKNAIAETAKDQADRYADTLKKERKWIELKPDSEFYALITQPFRFRDPGGAYR